MFCVKRHCRPGDRASGRDAVIFQLPDGSEVTVRVQEIRGRHTVLLIDAPEGVRVRRGEHLARAGEIEGGDGGPVA